MEIQENTEEKKKINGKKLAIIITASILVVVAIVGFSIFGVIMNVYGSAFFSSVNDKNSKAENYTKENSKCESNQIVFYGDSITEMYALNEYYPDITIYNRAISGDRVPHMIERFNDNVVRIAPKTLIFLGGANDLRDAVKPKEIAKNIETLLTTAKSELKDTKIIVQSVYPCNYTKKFLGRNLCKNMTNDAVIELNSYIKKICEDENIQYIDMFSKLADENNELKADLTIDGIHINDEAYKIVTSVLKEYIY